MAPTSPAPATRRWAVVLVVLGLLSLPVAAFAVAVSSNIYFLEAEATESEDVYVAATSARVFGTIDGDFLVAAGDVTIGGVVTGDVFVVTQGPVTIDGEVNGSLRGVAREVVINGSVGGDVAVASLVVDVAGEVGRDVLLLSGSLDVTGTVVRDILGRAQMTSLDGRIGGDVDILVSNLSLGSQVQVAGDVIYRSSDEATVSSEAEIAGSLSRLPSRGSFIVRSVLLFVTLLHFLSFLFAGLVLLWLLQPSTSAAVSQVMTRPWRSIGVGVLTFLVVPVIVVLLVFSLVGIPVGLLLLVLMLLALFFAPIPAVTAVGFRLLGGRGALFGGFVLGAFIWRGAIWLIPVVPLLIYVVSAVAGLGGFVLGVFERRRAVRSTLPVIEGPPRVERLPAEPSGGDEDWVAPLAPGGDRDAVSTEAEEAADGGDEKDDA